MPAPLLDVEIHGKAVPVYAGGHLLTEGVRHTVECVPFRDWVADIDPRVEVFSLRIQSVDYFGAGPPPAGRVGFVKLIADATLRPGDGVDARFHGGKIPGIVFLRGGAVCMLLVLESAATGEKFVVCCRQPRLASCDARFLELPAGMLDGSGAFAAVAIKEMEEETGITVGTGEMVDMTALVYGHDADEWELVVPTSCAPRPTGTRGRWPLACFTHMPAHAWLWLSVSVHAYQPCAPQDHSP